MDWKKIQLLFICTAVWGILFCACSMKSEEPSPTTVIVEATEKTETATLEEEFSGKLSGTVTGENGRVYLKCDTVYNIFVNGKLVDVEDVFFTGADVETALKMSGQHVSVKVRNILDNAGDVSMEVEFIEGETLLVPMGVFTLEYPAQWGEYLSVRCEVQERCTVYTFFCQYAEVCYPLFAVRIGDGLESILGFMLLPEREVEIGLESFESMLPETAEKTLTAVFNGMQEDINYLINALRENPSFNPAM